MLAKSAAAGSALSAVWHVMLLLSAAPFWWGVPLVVGLFLHWFPAVIGAARRGGLTFSGRGSLWVGVAALSAYAFVNTWLLGNWPIEQRASLGLSGILMALYAFAGAMLLPPQGVKS